MDWVLILGDGNLSYSYAFASHHTNARITATVLEDQETFMKTYQSGHQYVEQLERMAPRVKMKFGIDATRLTKEFADNFRYIVMNFPHPGGKKNTKRDRELLLQLFGCQREVLKTGAEFLLTLCASQAGLNLGNDIERYCRVRSSPSI